MVQLVLQDRRDRVSYLLDLATPTVYVRHQGDVPLVSYDGRGDDSRHHWDLEVVGCI